MNNRTPTGWGGGVLKLRVSYDGREFWGSQRQVGQRTVQGELESAAAAVFGQQIPIYLAGRTDRGVHAAGQVASFAEPRKVLSDSTVVAAMNDHLGTDVAVLSVERMPKGFHARYSAQWREYRYRIWTGTRQPLAEGWVWQLRSSLDLAAINRAANRLIGEHDFSSFASGGEGVPGSDRSKTRRGARRTVLACDARCIDRWWGPDSDGGQLIELRVVADGFLPRMVRGIAGVLVEVGRGAFGEADMPGLIEAADRRKAPKNAPPEGLVLWAVGYAPYSEER